MLTGSKKLFVIVGFFLILILLSGCRTSSPIVKKKSSGFQSSWKIPKQLPLSIYHNMEELFILKMASKKPLKVKVIAELKGVTEKEIKTVALNDTARLVRIKPQLKKGALEDTKTSRESQLILVIKDNRNKVLKESREKIKILPRRDMVWEDDEENDISHQIVSWVTPEDDKVKELIKAAANRTPFKSMPGYQEAPGYSQRDMTSLQLKALFEAMVKDFKMQYINTPVTTSGRKAQNVLLPAEVLAKSSGNCIELTVTIASALEALAMEPYIILTSDHSLIAVGEWSNSKNFIFIETTALEVSPQESLSIGDNVWQTALEEDDITNVINVVKIRDYGIKPMR